MAEGVVVVMTPWETGEERRAPGQPKLARRRPAGYLRRVGIGMARPRLVLYEGPPREGERVLTRLLSRSSVSGDQLLRSGRGGKGGSSTR